MVVQACFRWISNTWYSSNSNVATGFVKQLLRIYELIYDGCYFYIWCKVDWFAFCEMLCHLSIFCADRVFVWLRNLELISLSCSSNCYTPVVSRLFSLFLKAHLFLYHIVVILLQMIVASFAPKPKCHITYCANRAFYFQNLANASFQVFCLPFWHNQISLLRGASAFASRALLSCLIFINLTDTIFGKSSFKFNALRSLRSVTSCSFAVNLFILTRIICLFVCFYL